MQTLLIIIAVVASSALLFRATVKPRSPYVVLAERMSTNGLLYSLGVLGGRCVSTESGGGLSAARLYSGLKKSIKTIEKNAELAENRILGEVYDNKDIILRAADKARRTCRKSYALGHVDGMPRIFLLCKTLVEGARGDIDKKLISAAVETFSRQAPLDAAELAVLYDMLTLALCGLLSRCISDAEYCQKLYFGGRSDGAQGKIDLDSLSYDDYVCGLFDGASDKDAETFDALLVRNGISREDAARRRSDLSVELLVAVHSAICSLKRVGELGVAYLTELSAVDKIFGDIEEYRAASSEEKWKYIEAVGKRAKRRKSEIDFAVECVDNVNLAGRTLAEEVFAKSRDGVVKLVVACLIAAATVAAEIALCIALPIRYIAVAILSPTIFAYAFCRIAAAVCPPRFVEETTLGVFLHPPKRADEQASEILGRFRLLKNAGTRTELFVRVLCEMMPPLAALSGLVALTVCAVSFDYTVFFMAMLPYVAELVCALYGSVKNLSARELIVGAYAVYRLLYAPVYAVNAIISAICVAAGKDASVLGGRILRLVPRILGGVWSGVTIVLGGVFGGYIVCGVCGLQLVASVLDIPIPRLRAIKRTGTKTQEAESADREKSPPSLFNGYDTAYRANVIGGDGMTVTADSRGRIEVRGDVRVESGDFDIEIETAFGSYKLSRCDGAHFRGRTVYYAGDKNISVRAEIFAPRTPRCVAVCLHIVNRTAESITVRVIAKCLPRGATNGVALRVFECGISGGADEGYSRCEGRTLIAEGRFDIPGFWGKEIAACLFIASGSRAVTRAVAQVSGLGFISRERFAASEANAERHAALLPVAAEISTDNDMSARAGGYANVLSDGSLRAAVGTGGYEYSVELGRYLTRRRDGLDCREPTLVAVGDGNDIILLTDCETAVHGNGYTEYSREANGVKYSLKRYVARGCAAEIFDIGIECAGGERSPLDIMFSAVADCSVPIDVYRRGDNVYALGKADGCGFAVSSSLPIAECAFYREGYEAYGVIDRTADFRRGGREIAPTVSCRVEMPSGRARVVFALWLVGGEREPSGITEDKADEFFARETELFSATALCPETEYDALDSLYLRALYVAYTDGFLSNARDCDISIIAAKYIDGDGARRRILERLEVAEQIDGLILYVIEDYAEFSGEDIFSETVNGYTVRELCLTAVDRLISHAVDRDCGIADKISTLRHIKAFVNRCDEVKRRRYIKAMSVLAADVEKYFYCREWESPLDCVLENALYILGGCFSARGRSIVEELEPKITRLTEQSSHSGGERDAENVFSTLLIYCVAAFEVNDDERACRALKFFISAFSPCGELSDLITPRLCAMFYSLTTTKLFGLNICGDKATLLPHVSDDFTKVEYLLPKAYGRTRVSVGCGGSGEWNTSVGRITYATTTIGESETAGETIHLFRTIDGGQN